MASRRIPVVPLVLSTAAAMVATIAILVAFGDTTDTASQSAEADEPADGRSSSPDLVPKSGLPDSPPDVALVSLDGGPDRTLGEFLGQRPVVLNIFASWCAPCIEEMPTLERVHQDLGDQVTFLGLANRDNPDRARQIVEDTGVTYPTFADPESTAFTYFGGTAMPTTVFIDANGDVAEVVSRTVSEDDLRERIAEHFGVDA